MRKIFCFVLLIIFIVFEIVPANTEGSLAEYINLSDFIPVRDYAIEQATLLLDAYHFSVQSGITGVIKISDVAEKAIEAIDPAHPAKISMIYVSSAEDVENVMNKYSINENLYEYASRKITSSYNMQSGEAYFSLFSQLVNLSGVYENSNIRLPIFYTISRYGTNKMRIVTCFYAIDSSKYITSTEFICDNENINMEEFGFELLSLRFWENMQNVVLED